MDSGALIFFAFLGAIIIVPQVLRHQERARLHETLRIAFERGQPVPPELIMALQAGGRRYRYAPYAYGSAAGWQPGGAAAPTPPPAVAPETASAAAGEGPAAAPSSVPPPGSAAVPPLAPVFVTPVRSDLRRGLVWLAVGLGLVAAGGAFYAGLYDVGGAPETFATFAAFGSIPAFVGLTYLGLWWFESRKTKA